MMTKQLDIETQQKIADKYGKATAKSISEEYGCTIHQVYEVGRRFNKQRPHNKVVTITPEQHQLLLGGLLGDGRFKRNGKYNVYYSECHASGELGYLRWKFKALGELTEDSSIYEKNVNDDRYSYAQEFTTLTSPSLVPYTNLTRLETIQSLDELGLIIHLLDDGWFAYSNKERTKGRFCITTYNWSEEEREALAKQWMLVTGVTFYNHGIKRVNLGASSVDNHRIFEVAMKYLPVSLDVIQKKFRIVLPNV